MFRIPLPAYWVLAAFYFSAASAQMNNDQAWSEAWSWGNALVVKDNVAALYDSHASLLISTGAELENGDAPEGVIESLENLPGVSGVVISRPSGSSERSAGIDIDIDTFDEFVFNKSQATAKYKSPMMQRKVGGLTHFFPLRKDGKSFDLMVRYVNSDDGSLIAALSLVLNRDWLIPQIPSLMDSLSHENRQLLFWAESPLNKLVEQSLGILSGADTLWWSGKRNVIVANVQTLWPFIDIEVHSFVRRIDKR